MIGQCLNYLQCRRIICMVFVGLHGQHSDQLVAQADRRKYQRERAASVAKDCKDFCAIVLALTEEELRTFKCLLNDI